MPNTTLLDDFRALSVTNNEYGRNRDRWRFLYESYIGGEEYRRAGHLTRYQLETAADFQARLLTTPLDNQCQSVIQTYTSFLFREHPEREFLGWENLEDYLMFLRDCDYEGRSFDNFMKQVSIWASVFGHCWTILTKPNVGAQSLGQQQDLGIRPYINLLTPLVVSDWRWTREINGAYKLVYFKYIEEVIDKITIIKEWTPEVIRTWALDDYKKEAQIQSEEVNELGIIPAVVVYNQRSVVKGIGVSDINDIADIQKMIYNLTSENEQGIRLDGHPSLVIPPTAQMGSGAGALIVLQEGSDPGLNPYYLESNGVSIENIHKSIDKLIAAVDRIANTGGVRGTEVKERSGVAMEVEFQLLNARLAEKAGNLELAEEQIWELFGLYQGRPWMGKIEYPRSFNIRDLDREIDNLVRARGAATDPILYRVIDEKLLEAIGSEKEMLNYQDIQPIEGRTYPDGEAIPQSLPPLYIPADDPEVPNGQNCANCEYYKATESYCIKFDAPVRPIYWCAKWDQKHED